MDTHDYRAVPDVLARVSNGWTRRDGRFHWSFLRHYLWVRSRDHLASQSRWAHSKTVRLFIRWRRSTDRASADVLHCAVASKTRQVPRGRCRDTETIGPL